jgi:hypothetical protein
MEKMREKLLGFVKTYVKNKDLMFRRIESVTDNENGFFVKYKHKESQFLAEPVLNPGVIEKIAKIKNVSVICINTKENLDFVVKRWKELSNYQNLNVYFVNPFSKMERIWIIHPYTHSRVADNESLELGLKTMFENVEEISPQEFGKLTE